MDHHGPYRGRSGGSFKGLDLKEPLYIGGVPNFAETHRLSGFDRGFVGKYILYLNSQLKIRRDKINNLFKRLPLCEIHDFLRFHTPTRLNWILTEQTHSTIRLSL